MNGTDATAETALTQSVIHVSGLDRARTWRRVTLAAVAAMTLLDGALLQRKHALFTGGFLVSRQFPTVVDGVAFLLSVAIVNAAVIAPVVLMALALARRLRLRRHAAIFVAWSAGLLPLTVADFVTYQVWSYVGDAFDFHVMRALTGHGLSEVFAVASPLISRPLSMVVLACGAIAGITVLLQRGAKDDTDGVVIPSAASAWKRCLALLALSSVLVTGMSITSDAVGFGLRWTSSGQIFSLALDELSDVDRDGYGLLRSPRDGAPLDRAIYPYAIDIPGNAIDENGLAGDLSTKEAQAHERAAQSAPWPVRPPVILFVLESVRNDVVGAVYNGRPVTPVMDALAGDGLRVEGAWAHAGSTTQSRYHLLTGSLVEGNGDSTLLQDFKRRGYDVAYFSGQDDDFGSMGLNYKAVDKFYDARQDITARYSASTSPGSLAVPLNIVETRIAAYLNGRTREKPLFLYVNFHDTHYPYNHPGLENLLGVELLPASAISPGRRRDLMATYLNATANVDRAIGRVIDAVQSHTSQHPAVVVAGDHGESLFDQGVLGHGFTLSDVQTRVPVIFDGLPVKITMPFGLADVRWAVNDALETGDIANRRPSSQWTTTAHVFQYVGPVRTPVQIGWMTRSGSFTYDFRSERVSIWEGLALPGTLRGAPRSLFEDLVHTWERIVLAPSQRHRVD
jgi:hypothetical protein